VAVNIGDLDILPPYSSPKWCDHGPVVKTCSRCDPSEHSGRLRAREARAQAARFKGTPIASSAVTIIEADEKLREKED
jgi:hypothetical protein